jgi:glycosyltransferase involved in cell wall biosynthesis
MAAMVRAGARARLSGRAALRADVVVGVHPDWRVNIPSRPREFVYIPTIVDELFFQARRHPLPGRVLYFGGPGYIKGWDVLSKAWPLVANRIKGARLEAVGFPADYRLSTPSEVGRTTEIRGWLSARQTREAMERAALVVIPSRFEVASTVLAEAWAAAVPIVATAVGGTPALARGAAVLIPYGNPLALASAISDVLRRRVAVSHIVHEGLRRAQRHRSHLVVESHLRVYSALGAR